MKNSLLIAFLFGSLFSFSQTSIDGHSTRRAVVIGISDYQHHEIPDLQFAHRDAEAFAQYLRSTAGGQLDDDHLKLLTNEQATTAQFAAALDWLIDESKEGDKAIIYFSGHGDVERKTRTQLGFLLTWDSPPKMYVAGAFPIFYLQEVVSTLSLENKAKVIIITDACRSGKLAGGGVNGSQLTNANLSKQFANEIKIMSCQPNEYSIEGEQWGSGRGAFSYHLVDGLYGMADKNTDMQVTLSEIDRYLEDRVTPEVAPISQAPMTVGFKSEPLAYVDKILLASIQADKSKQINAISKVENKGIEEDVLSQADSTTRQYYYAWKEAIANKQFFEPTGTCANELYLILSKESSLTRLYNHMKRNYAAALQDDAQQMLNDYLYASHKEIDMPVTIRVSRYTEYIKQLKVAIELLGHDHYMYKSLTGKKLFIEAMYLDRTQFLNKGSDVGYTPEINKQIISLLKKALEFEPEAAYTLSWLGLLIFWGETADEIQKGINYIEKATEIAPTWGHPYIKLGIYYLNKNPEKAHEIYSKALITEPNSPFILGSWGSYLENLGQLEEAEAAYRKAVQLDSTYAKGYRYLGNLFWKKSELEKANFYYQQYINWTENKKDAYLSLGFFFRIRSENLFAEKYLKASLVLDSTEFLTYWNLAWVYYSNNRKQEAYHLLNNTVGRSIQNSQKGNLLYLKGLFEYYEGHPKESLNLFQKAEDLQASYYTPSLYLAVTKLINKEISKTILFFEEAIKQRPGDTNIKYIYCQLKIEQGEFDGALDLLEAALVIGGRTYDFMNNDPKLEPIRNMERYKNLMKRYFPRKIQIITQKEKTMKKILPIVFLFGSVFSFSQILGDKGTTRAVVIGISDYQNNEIPDLRFADKDAEAFATYLQSSAGGKLHDENIKVLTNETATMAAVAAQLDWLVEESSEGDKAIIYFSGHGDVEAKTARQPGFLLTYDSPPKIYIAGAYPLFYLQLIIETLSSDKNVQTIVITDACRAGKLAGSEIGGTQATAANLAKQYANEIKILSCQPDEFSLEGEQWGGGRGAFSYHLIEGLIGLADKNENQQVNLLELENYLETIVPEETNPQSQIPMTLGSKGTKLSYVDADILKELISLKERQLPTLAAIESRGIEESLLANLDTSIQIMYDAFIAALDEDNLLDALDGKPSADELYRQLIKEESINPIKNSLTRQFATALQDDAQQAINAYLLAKPIELEKRWEGDTTYTQYPRYLGRAAELLGESHYMHNYLIAKQLYFEGLSLRLQGDQSGQRGSLYVEAIQKQKAAVLLEDRAAYFYNELGVLHARMKLDDKAFDYYDQAIELAPEWALPYVNYAVGLYYNGEIEKAMEYGEKAGNLMRDFPQIYSFLAWINANNYSWRDKKDWTRKGTELQDNYSYEWDRLSNMAQVRQRLGKSIELLKKAVVMDPEYLSAYYDLGYLLQQIRKYKEAIIYYKKVTELDTLHSKAFGSLGSCYNALGNRPESEKYTLKAISLDSTATYLYNNLGILYGNWGKPDKAIKFFKKLLALNPGRAYYTNIGYQYQKKNLLQLSENYNLRSALYNYNYGSNHPSPYRRMGSFYKDYLKRYDAAADLYQMALEIKPDYVSALKSLAEVYIKMDQTDKIAPLIEQLEKLAADNVYLFFDVAYIYFQMGEKERAIEILQKQVADHADDPDILETVAWRYQYDFGAYPEAEDLFLKALELKGDSTVIYTGLGFTCLRDGQTKKSWEYFQKMINRDSSAFNHYGIATYYSFLGQNELALEWLEKSFIKGFSTISELQWDKDLNQLRETPEFDRLVRKYFPEVFTNGGQLKLIESDAYYPENCVLLARIYESKGFWEKAKAMYEKAIDLKTESLSAKQALALAESYMKLGEHKSAQSICPEAIESDDPEELYESGKLFYLLGKNKQALAHFEKYIKGTKIERPKNWVGIFYKDHGEFDLALKYFKAAIEDDPDRMALRRNIARLYFFFDQKEEAFRVLQEALHLHPEDSSTRGVYCLLSYYDQDIATKALFEQYNFLPIWDGLELMRNNQFDKANEAWQDLQSTHNYWWLNFARYKYLQMKIREGKLNEAMQIFEEKLVKNFGRFVNYQLYKTDPELDPIRDTEKYKEMMHIYFPEKH